MDWKWKVISKKRKKVQIPKKYGKYTTSIFKTLFLKYFYFSTFQLCPTLTWWSGRSAGLWGHCCGCSWAPRRWGCSSWPADEASSRVSKPDTPGGGGHIWVLKNRHLRRWNGSPHQETVPPWPQWSFPCVWSWLVGRWVAGSWSTHRDRPEAGLRGGAIKVLCW